ncbi:hypothetical protein [Ferroacidibacillus organovorans]|uniref:Uncharacterized protein n=1 Tax=Ferroacidibacillus organovorans TaxID=1765683 RepID=A0A162SX26_9BACL|nr:hypothetical protein [Ferroacidibacillus organovorans]KYP80237.1 hypothetical protein AYJ22_12060 [Ferroacidibacillus organovorans]OAG93222.1 hypothetical protein AYW79_11830 [Ferroacidibacillus organovorans]OPG17050.1 hypothetical protein B2M26_03355 [Ferroacidibacillus organovorans]
MEPKKIYEVAIYLRKSRDDSDGEDSIVDICRFPWLMEAKEWFILGHGVTKRIARQNNKRALNIKGMFSHTEK